MDEGMKKMTALARLPSVRCDQDLRAHSKDDVCGGILYHCR
jgi:hypothetical protein